MITKYKKILTCILAVLILFTIGFIFQNSMESKEESGQKSEIVKEVVNNAIEALGGEEEVTDYMVRKMAHFLEFFALGLEITTLCMLHHKSLVWEAFLGLLVALTDETIQISSSRGSAVQDVWLDFFGVIVAMLLVCFLVKGYELLKKYKVGRVELCNIDEK